MGHVTAKIAVENAADRCHVDAGRGGPVRAVTVSAAVVDVPLTVALPAADLAALGLRAGGPVRVTVAGETCTVDVTPARPGSPATVGRLVLMATGLGVDPAAGTLTADPARGGRPLEAYGIAA